MVKFFLRKSFFDGWDNFSTLFVRNAEYAALGILYFILVRIPVLSSAVPFYFITFLFLFLYSCLYLGNYGVVSSWVSDTSLEHPGFFSMLKQYKTHLVFLFAIILFEILSFSTIIPFYFSMGNIVGYVLGVFIFWLSVLLGLPLQFFLPMAIIKNGMPIDSFKKCIAMAFSNKGFTLLLFLKTILQMILSVVTIALIPGFTGVSISHYDAAILLLLREDYMRENNISNRKAVDYEELFREESEKLGKRNLGSILSPWKHN